MYLETEDGKIYYEVQGQGQPLIFIHGNQEDRRIFYRLAGKLKNHYRLYLVDSRYHGLSHRQGEFSYQAMKEDILQLIEDLGLIRPNLLGFSDGGVVGLLLAMENPQILKNLLVLGVNLSPRDFPLEDYREMEEEYKKTQDPYLGLMLKEPNIGLEDLKKIQAKTLILAGERDIFPRSLYLDMETFIKNCQLKILTGQDHYSYIVNSDMIYEDIIDFIGG